MLRSHVFPAEIAAHRIQQTSGGHDRCRPGGRSASSSQEAAVPAPDETIHVQAWEGLLGIVFKMKLRQPFWKMIKHWCRKQNVHDNEVRFVFRGRHLKPDDTPSSCGWSAAIGQLHIDAARC